MAADEGAAGLVTERGVVFGAEGSFEHARLAGVGAVALEAEPLRAVLVQATRHGGRGNRDREQGEETATRRVFVHHEFRDRTRTGAERQVLGTYAEHVARVVDLRGRDAREPRGIVNGEPVGDRLRRVDGRRKVPVDRIGRARGARVDPVHLLLHAAVAGEGLGVDRIEGGASDGEFAGEPGEDLFHADAGGRKQFDIAGPGVVPADIHQRALGVDERIIVGGAGAADGDVLLEVERRARVWGFQVQCGPGENVNLGLNRVAEPDDIHAECVVVFDRNPALFDLRHALIRVRTGQDEVPGSAFDELRIRAARDLPENREAVVAGEVVGIRRRMPRSQILIHADGGIRTVAR